MTHAAYNDKVAAMIGYYVDKLLRQNFSNSERLFCKEGSMEVFEFDFLNDANAQDMALEWCVGQGYDVKIESFMFDWSVHINSQRLFEASEGILYFSFIHSNRFKKQAVFLALVQLANHLTEQK